MRLSFAAQPGRGYANDPLPRRADPSSLQTLGGPTMGTRWSLRFDNPALLPLAEVRAVVEASLGRVVAQMSTWEPESDICRFARAAAGSRHRLAPEFAEVMACALRWAEASGGAIDPSVAGLVGLWGFGARAMPAAMPAPDVLAAAHAKVGWKRLRFDPATGSIEQPGGVALDLSAIAKGFAVDLASHALLARGVDDFLLEVGGELRAAGRRPGGGTWQVELDIAPGTSPRIGLTEMALATSGDRWQRRSTGDRHWSHTIDPRNGRPAPPTIAAVSVLHPSCMEADALATVLTVLGLEAGPAFAERHGIAALMHWRDTDGRLRARPSSAWPTAHAS